MIFTYEYIWKLVCFALVMGSSLGNEVPLLINRSGRYCGHVSRVGYHLLKCKMKVCFYFLRSLFNVDWWPGRRDTNFSFKIFFYYIRLYLRQFVAT